MRTFWARLRGLVALTTLLGLVVGIPLGLAALIGNPLHGWADLKVSDINNEVVIDLLAVVVWLAWAQFAASVLVEVAGVVRHVRMPARIPLVPQASQNLAHALVGAVLLIGMANVALASPVYTLAATPDRVAVVSVACHPNMAAAEIERGGVGMQRYQRYPDGGTATPRAANAGSQRSIADRGRSMITYVVPRDGHGPDTYWDIAEAHLGGGEHWIQIWKLNQGRTQADGDVMSSPGMLKPGWTVLLPATATDSERVTVLEGDTLSGIAAAHGQTDWHVAWAANKDRAEPGGRQLTDPNLILPGWTIDLATASAPTTSTPPTTQPSVPDKPPPTTRAQRTTQPPVGTRRPSATTQAPATTDPSPALGASTTAAPTQAEPLSHEPAAHRTRISSELPMVAFAGGGLLLAGVSSAALERYRRRQFRWRRPGRTIASSPPELQRGERSVLSRGSVGSADVTWLNEALRSLVHAQAGIDDARLPDVVAARLSAEQLELVLAESHPNAPAPWRVDKAGTRWSIQREDDLGYDPAARAFHFAPFPTLASVGYTAGGDQWLLDLERAGAISLSGDPERCLNLARFVAAELAHNVWSEMLQVTLVGFGAEMAEINPARLTYTANIGDLIATLSGDLEAAAATMRDTDTDVLTARLRNVAMDSWAPHVVLIAANAGTDGGELEHLAAALSAQRSRTALALVLANDPDLADAARWQLTVDETGTLRIPALGVELIAQQIPADEAGDLTRMLALAARTDDHPIPDAEGDKPWDAYADAAGGLRCELTTPESLHGDTYPSPAAPDAATSAAFSSSSDDAGDIATNRSASETATSVLPLPAQTYLDHAATMAADLDTLAPALDERTRREVRGLDPSLDEDLEAWQDPSSTRPKVAVLGPVAVTAHGELPPERPRLLWNTEVVTYLATRSSGVSTERYATDLWPDDPAITTKTKVRQSIVVVRKWLGTNPRTGQPYLPKSPVVGQANNYRIEDVLLDAELFRRLRLREVTRGPQGIGDLQAALDLVRGVPFSGRRPDGYGWLTEDPLEYVYAGMIVDVAHIVATRHLGAGEPELAVRAAQVALKSGSGGDVPLLDLVAACDAQGNRAEADAYVKRILANNDVEEEEDLPPRTAEILFHRQRVG